MQPPDPATTNVPGGTLIVSKDDTTKATVFTLDLILLTQIAYIKSQDNTTNGNTTLIQDNLENGYRNAVQRKFIPIPVGLAISGFIGVLSIFLSDQHFFDSNTQPLPLSSLRIELSVADVDEVTNLPPDPNVIVISTQGMGQAVTLTMPPVPSSAAVTSCPSPVSRSIIL